MEEIERLIDRFEAIRMNMEHNADRMKNEGHRFEEMAYRYQESNFWLIVKELKELNNKLKERRTKQ